jgi:DNA segregation ATPase FtsK/SpoIIIE-like protein
VRAGEPIRARSRWERREQEPIALAVGVAGALWRLRLELGLVALLVCAHVLLSNVVGDVVAVLVVGVGAVGVLAVPAVRRWVLGALRAARVRRAWWRAWTDSGLPRVRAGRVTAIPAGELVRVRASRGSSLDAVEQRAEQLAVCLQAREVRIARAPDNAATGTVTLVRRDPLAGLASVRWPRRDADALSLWEPIPIGIDELGATVTVSLAERNVLMGGEPGAGKSAALSLLVATAALDASARLWLLDGKLVELSAWTPCAQRLAGPDIDEAIALLRELRSQMEARYRELLARGRRKVSRGDELALHLVACDELAFYLGHEDRKRQREFAELLRDLVARGRAAGVIVCAATQKPASDVVPSALRDLFGFRLALRCNTPQASDTILGQGWATLGHSAASIAPGQRGVGLLLAEDGTPVRIRGYHLTDADVDALAERAAAQRANEWLAAAEGAGS